MTYELATLIDAVFEADRSTWTPCPYCEGRGHDDDMLWPHACDHCRGTGMELDEDDEDDSEAMEEE